VTSSRSSGPCWVRPRPCPRPASDGIGGSPSHPYWPSAMANWGSRLPSTKCSQPPVLQASARGAIKEVYQAPSKAECCRRRAEYCTQLRAQAQGDAADCLERDWDDFVTFYDYPRSTGCTSAPRTPSSRSSLGCGAGWMLPSGCTGARKGSTWSWSCGSAPSGIPSTAATNSDSHWPANASSTATCNELNQPPSRLPPPNRLPRLPGGNSHKS